MPFTRLWTRYLATVFITVFCMVPVTLGFTSIAVKHSQRRSDVHSCEAVDRISSGIEKLVGQLRHVTAISHHSAAYKAQQEAGFALLLGDFPKLDCSANPINFVVSP